MKRKCLQCGYEWKPKTANPRQCGRCKTSYWNVPSNSPTPKISVDFGDIPSIETNGFLRQHQEYVAGIFDAEGYVGKRGKRLRLSFGNTNGEVVAMFKKEFGGCMYEQKRKSTKHKHFWMWESSSLSCPEFCTILEQCFVKSKLLTQKRPFVISDEYAAGMFDGDGSVTIRKQSGGPTFFLAVEITSILEEHLKFFKARYGGTIYPPYGKIRHSFCWRILCTKAAEFLRAILPYSLIKRGRIWEALKLAKLNAMPKTVWRRSESNGWKYGLLVKDPTLVAEMFAIKQRMLSMNRLGV